MTARRTARMVATAVATVWFAAVGVAGGGLFAWRRVGDFYDAQAHAWFAGRWNVPRSTLGIEAFITDGKAYMYFGPTPAVLRLPFVLLFGHRLDGRLTLLSMIVAFALAAWCAGCILDRLRRYRHEDDTRVTVIADALVLVALMLGGPLLFLAGRAWVYHEAILWGVAFALAAFAVLLRYLDDPRVANLVWFGVLAVASIGARPPTGLAVVFAGFFVALFRFVSTRKGAFAHWCRDAVGAMPPRSSAALGFIGVGVLAIASYVVVNVIKFGMLFGIPADRQYQAVIDPARQEFLRRSGGSFFLIGAVPTNVWQWVRPDAIGFSRSFPWVTFPSGVAHVFGDVPFDLLDKATSITAASPLLVALAIVGAVAVFRRTPFAVLRAPVLGAAFGTAVTLTIAYVAQRYQADFVVLLLPLAIAGWLWAWPWLRARWWRAALVAVLAVWGVTANTATAVVYQRQVSPDIPPELRANFVALQRRLPGGAPAVAFGDALPAEAGPFAQLFVVGDCAALYQSDGRRWWPVERDARAGHFRLRLSVPEEPGIYPVIGSGKPDDANLLAMQVRRNGDVRFLSAWDYDGGGVQRGEWVDIGDRPQLDVVMDPNLNEVSVRAGTRVVLAAPYFHPRPGWQVGRTVGVGAGPLRDEVAAEFPRRIDDRGTSTPQCAALRK